MEGILNVLLSGKLGIKPVFFPGEIKTQNHLAPKLRGVIHPAYSHVTEPQGLCTGLTFPV